MKAGTFLLGAFAVLCGLVGWFLWDRTLHFNLWIDYLSPCLFPAILLVGFGGLYRRGMADRQAGGEEGFGPFMKRNGLAYTGLLGTAMVALWWREGFEAVPYILFFGLPYFGGIFAATAVIALLSYFWPVVRTLFLWLWLGFGVCYGASCLALAGKAWTIIPFVLMLVPGLARGRRQLSALLLSPWPWCLAAGALTLAGWHYVGFWRMPWNVTPIPYGLIPWAVGAGAVCWAGYRFGGIAVRRAASIFAKGLAVAVTLTVLLFAGAGGWNYLVQELVWKTEIRYTIVFEAQSAQSVQRAEEVVTVERKVLPCGWEPRNSLREHGSFPSLTRAGGSVVLADLRMDRKYLKTLPLIAREALAERTGEVAPLTDAPLELVGRARPAIEIISALEGGAMRAVPYERNGLGIRFRVWIEVQKGWDALDRLFVLRREPS
jgi:hypothetical protein